MFPVSNGNIRQGGLPIFHVDKALPRAVEVHIRAIGNEDVPLDQSGIQPRPRFFVTAYITFGVQVVLTQNPVIARRIYL